MAHFEWECYTKFLVMGRDQNLRKLIVVYVILRFLIYGNSEISDLTIFPTFRDFEWKSSKFCVISREIAKITGIGREHNWHVTWNIPKLKFLQLTIL